MMRPAFRTDLGSLLAIGVGAVGGVALTAGLLVDRSHVTVHEHLHVHRDHVMDVWVTPEIRYKHAVEAYKVIIDGDEVMHEHEHDAVSEMHLDIDVPLDEAGAVRRLVVPQMRMSGPEAMRSGQNPERVRVSVEAKKGRRR